MRDLYACGFERQDAGLCSTGVGAEVNQHIQVSGRDGKRRIALRHVDDLLEAIRKPTVALGPFIAYPGQRIEIKLETVTVVVPQRLPHHLAHDMVAQIRREVSDAQL